MTRDEVLIEFHEPYDVEIVPGLRRGGMQLNTEAMADEIVRLRAILAELTAVSQVTGQYDLPTDEPPHA